MTFIVDRFWINGNEFIVVSRAILLARDPSSGHPLVKVWYL